MMNKVNEVFNVSITKMPLKRKIEYIFDKIFFLIVIAFLFVSIRKIIEFDKGWGWYILLLLFMILLAASGLNQKYVSNVIFTEDDIIIETKGRVLSIGHTQRYEYSFVREFYIEDSKIKGSVAGADFQLIVKPEYVYIIKDLATWVNQKSKEDAI